jgi:hypothetical protein
MLGAVPVQIAHDAAHFVVLSQHVVDEVTLPAAQRDPSQFAK